MSDSNENSAVKPTVIDLDPDQVVDDGKPAGSGEDIGAAAPRPESNAPAARPQRTRALPVAFAALVIGAVAGGWLYKDMLSSYFPSDHVLDLTQRLNSIAKDQDGLATQVQALDRLAAQLKTDVDALESAGGALATETKSLAGALDALRGTVSSLDVALGETRAALDDIAKRPAATGGNSSPQAGLSPDLAGRIEVLEKEVAALKAQKTGNMDSIALSQDLADLKAKIAAGAAYRDEYDRIARMVPAAAGLDVLGAHAAQGLPTAKVLAAELAVLKSGLPRAENAQETVEAGGWWDQAKQVLSGIITIRDAGVVDWQRVAERAIAFAEAEELPQAVAEIDAVEEAAPAGLQRWRDRAAARIALEAGVASAAASISNALAARQ